MDRSRLAIVIPAFNESKTIASIVNKALVYGIPIVVDDGSSDETANLAREAGANVISHKINLGYDKALNSGFIHADQLNCVAVITLDADGQHNPRLIDQFVSLLDEGADVVVGIRGEKQRFAEQVFASVSMRLYGIADPLCGMKAYRLEVFRSLGHFDSYGSVGTELSIFAAKSGYVIRQLMIPILERSDAPRFGQGWRANFRIFRAMILSFFKIRSIAH